MENLATYIIAAVVFGAMGLVARRIWGKRGSGTCASGCGGCAEAGNCSSYEPPKKSGCCS